MSKDEISCPGNINWLEDSWFSRYWADNATDEFKAWWVDWYGPPCRYPVEESDIYWTRCGFALMGWLAGRKQILEETNKEAL